ncbi:cysteine desulfurase [Roseimicrobium gellanilyticum]|uniref:cysteine desulfurase n=1 Tax=Roseimicrobium gellanilyticum TaxID=748857 RepID=A0A366H7A5_9BACT|nr:cysteine desulfurase family protein [Roseimicrobium gellanilyticum]RBP37321.1 cysteine desulfurase [Roseimicrobium gellanilyticum]
MPGYFDHNATTPLHPVAREAWLKASERHWHNPSGLYREAAETKHRLEEARERLGKLLECEPQRIVFTSGATEANNAVLRMLAAKLPGDSTVLTCCMEHPSVQVPLRAAFGKRVREVPPRPDTSLDWEAFTTALQTQRPALATFMAANNECGTLLPWLQIGIACRDAGVRFHCDATQWIGKMPGIQLGQCCDYITGSAHKFGGPKGVGFLVLSSEDEALGLLTGGPQEEGRRAGTENYPSIEAMVTVLEHLMSRLESMSAQVELREAFEKQINLSIPGTKIVGQGTQRLWNTSMLILPRHDHRKWLARLSQQGFAVSTGSACSAGHDGASQVLQAIGATQEEMKRVLRISGGWETTEEEWSGLTAAMVRVRDSLDG